MNTPVSEQPLALIVEDDDNLLTIFTRAIEAGGFSAQSVKNGKEALEALQRCPPALVVLDLHLPDMIGDKILSFIRQDVRFARTLVILATADAAMAGVIDDQSDLVLLKPISFSQMRDLAARLRVTVNQ
jgi:CheY-like chemotaxis protein